MKTHQVLDLHYLPEEGQGCFDGTRQECEEFAATQSPHFMYKVVPMTKAEIDSHPDNLRELAMNWWNGLAALRKTQLCDTNTELVGHVRRYETLTSREIQAIYKKEHQ